MVAFLTDWLAVLALLLCGVFLSRRLALSAGWAPLFGVGFGMLFLQLAGSVRLLWPGALLLLTAPWLGAAWYLWHRKPLLSKIAHTLYSPGLLAFLAAVAVLQLAYALRVPRFQTWDEFSHWGVFFKSVFYSHSLAQWNPGYGLVHQSYPQGIPALYALFAFLKGSYQERDCFFVTALPLLACAAALPDALAPAHASKKAAGVHLLCSVLAVPVFFWLFSPDTPYYTAYMDAPVGAVFGAGLVLTVLPAAEEQLLQRGLALGFICAVLSTIKEIGSVFALCILGIWTIQLLIDVFARRQRLLHRFWAPLGAAFLPFGCVLGCWKLFLTVLHRTDDQFSDMGMDYFLQCWQEARSGEDVYFYTIWNNFFSRVRTFALLFGWSTLKLAVLFSLAGLVCAVLLRHFAHDLRSAAAPLCMIGYFPCYMAVLFYVYIGGMSPYEAEQVASYDRYACCFFIAWMMLLLCCIGRVLCALPAARLHSALAFVVPVLLAFSGVQGLLAGDAPLVGVTSLPYEDWRDAQRQNAESILTLLQGQPEGKVWVLSAEDDVAYRNLWFYQYELLPQLSDVELPSGGTDFDLLAKVHGHDISYLVLLGVTEDFAAEYSTCFEDGLAAAKVNGTDCPTVYALQRDDRFVLLG